MSDLQSRSNFEFRRRIGISSEMWIVSHRLSKEQYLLRIEPNTINTRRTIYIQKNLRHPSILSLHGHFVQGQSIYMIYEYVEDGTLEEYISKKGGLSEEEGFLIFSGALSAIDYLHSHVPAILHRNINSASFLLRGCHALLTDFRHSNFLLNEKRRRTVCGNLEYIPPEMVEDISQDTSVDVWSLGVLLFEILTGTLPFSSQVTKNTLARITTSKIHFPDTLSPLAKDLISKMLVPDRLDRIKVKDIYTHRWFLYFDEYPLAPCIDSIVLVPYVPTEESFEELWDDDSESSSVNFELSESECSLRASFIDEISFKLTLTPEDIELMELKNREAKLLDIIKKKEQEFINLCSSAYEYSKTIENADLQISELEILNDEKIIANEIKKKQEMDLKYSSHEIDLIQDKKKILADFIFQKEVSELENSLFEGIQESKNSDLLETLKKGLENMNKLILEKEASILNLPGIYEKRQIHFLNSVKKPKPPFENKRLSRIVPKVIDPETDFIMEEELEDAAEFCNYLKRRRDNFDEIIDSLIQNRANYKSKLKALEAKRAKLLNMTHIA